MSCCGETWGWYASVMLGAMLFVFFQKQANWSGLERTIELNGSAEILKKNKNLEDSKLLQGLTFYPYTSMILKIEINKSP